MYVFAGLLAIYALWAYSHWVDIISQARAAGQLAPSGNEYDIASYYMSNCGQYFIYALLLAAAGLILHRKQPMSVTEDTPVQHKKTGKEDGELDEWFDEVESVNNIKPKVK